MDLQQQKTLAAPGAIEAGPEAQQPQEPGPTTFNATESQPEVTRTTDTTQVTDNPVTKKGDDEAHTFTAADDSNLVGSR